MAFAYLQPLSGSGLGSLRHVKNILDVFPSEVKEQCFPLGILCNAFSFEKELK